MHHLPPLTSHEDTFKKNLETGVVDSLRHNRELLEHNLIQRVLMTNAYNLSRAANALGISRVTLHQKIKKYGLRAGRRAHQDSHRPEQAESN